MKGILVSEPFKYALTDLPVPECGAGQVLVRTAFCGICGTDIEILRGSVAAGQVRYPVVPGHEWTGIIVETGPAVGSWVAGDRVSVEGTLKCGWCPYCLAGETNLCISHQQIGFTQHRFQTACCLFQYDVAC